MFSSLIVCDALTGLSLRWILEHVYETEFEVEGERGFLELK